ncbi:MAG: hypothetical protein A3H45_12020 [Ignavibacteria bacterium RIFCSPLOWO2_02_FULL_55_14]|nr:MAG: hypothetical protein A2X68_03035 [Ignavibacteria bacterium GWC2_56_12]OGU62759.1 MAG: hypothetical protein A3C56_11725 [Ignavibacteria bacterium RIFCSPHIGHO2_02_FULL_56_12]OGU69775.1 MAG: hypothetical protein A3H45_12020 [Ignavibacteria bacterium RIFCSPLOWO2_02_FULL_55_14]OGU73230.1 MAG: hypothetical protein A3G43_02350 [Ignavibacteria bacterium RIFCSPLOWO2_12_FULL_56_21]
MKSVIPPQDHQLLSRLLDGDLSDRERDVVELRIAKEPDLRTAYEELVRLRSLVRDLPHLPPDPFFWTRVKAALDSTRDEEKNLLPFPRSYLPAVVAAAFIVIVGAGLILVQNRLSILTFWERQSTALREAYQQGVVQGSLLPFFSNLDADRTLQFALYGTLPLDEEKGTTLKVDERSSTGYRIEVQKELPRKIKKLTVTEFMTEVQPTVSQRATLDSVLKAAREELEASVLVGADDAMAINVDLHRLNKAVVSGLVACLQPQQRVKFNRLLEEREAPYTVVSRSKEVRQADEVIKSFHASPKGPEFVVVTADSMRLSRFHVNMEAMRQSMSEGMIEEMALRRERAIRRLVSTTAEFDGPVIAHPDIPRMSVTSRKDRLTIELTQDSATDGAFFFNISVAPRIPVEELDGAFEQRSREGGSIPGTVRSGDFRGRVYVAPSPTVKGMRSDTAAKLDRKSRKPFKLDLRQ